MKLNYQKFNNVSHMSNLIIFWQSGLEKILFKTNVHLLYYPAKHVKKAKWQPWK